MERREFITLLGATAAVWPIAARAEQYAMPMAGYLSTRSLDDSAYIVAAFRKGLNETGYSEGRDVMIEWRFAEGHYDRLPALVADLVRRQLNILVATGDNADGICDGRRPGQTQYCPRPCTTARQRHGNHFPGQRTNCQATSITTRTRAQGQSARLSREPERSQSLLTIRSSARGGECVGP